jgi:hypothetical protein
MTNTSPDSAKAGKRSPHLLPPHLNLFQRMGTRMAVDDGDEEHPGCIRVGVTRTRWSASNAEEAGLVPAILHHCAGRRESLADQA